MTNCFFFFQLPFDQFQFFSSSHLTKCCFFFSNSYLTNSCFANSRLINYCFANFHLTRYCFGNSHLTNSCFVRQLAFGLFRLRQLSLLPISCFVKPFCRHPLIPFSQFPFCRVPFGQFRFLQFPLILPNSCFAKSDFDQPDNTNGKMFFPFRHALFSNTFSVAR